MLEKIKNIQVRKHTKDQKGFTLVELMATLGILALIVAIAVPAIGSIMGKAGEQASNSDYEMLVKSAEIAYATDPGNDEGVFVIAGTGDTQTVTTTATKLSDKGFLDFDAASSLKGPEEAVKTGNGTFKHNK